MSHAQLCGCGGYNENCSRCWGRGEFSASHPDAKFCVPLLTKDVPPRPMTVTSQKAFAAAAGLAATEWLAIRKRESDLREHVGCPACRFEGTACRTRRHYLRKHKWLGFSFQDCRRLGADKTPLPDSFDDELRTSRSPKGDADCPVAVSGTENQMDASRNIGYPAREGSKYGSHPAHDDFGDESEA